MAVVDPEEDSLRRFVALHRSHDQQRREWRGVVLGAFDDGALEHGVWPPGWDPRDPPDGVSVLTAGDPDRPA